jgi:hypothetical protein
MGLQNDVKMIDLSRYHNAYLHDDIERVQLLRLFSNSMMQCVLLEKLIVAQKGRNPTNVHSGIRKSYPLDAILK